MTWQFLICFAFFSMVKFSSQLCCFFILTETETKLASVETIFFVVRNLRLRFSKLCQVNLQMRICHQLPVFSSSFHGKSVARVSNCYHTLILSHLIVTIHKHSIDFNDKSFKVTLFLKLFWFFFCLLIVFAWQGKGACSLPKEHDIRCHWEVSSWVNNDNAIFSKGKIGVTSPPKCVLKNVKCHVNDLYNVL